MRQSKARFWSRVRHNANNARRERLEKMGTSMEQLAQAAAARAELHRKLKDES